MTRYAYGPISDWTLLTLQLTSEESISRHVTVQMVDILNTFREQTCKQFAIFHVFLVYVVSVHHVRFFTVLTIDGR